MNKKFFIDYGQIVRCLPVTVEIKNPRALVSKKCNAIFDTGATRSAITQKIFKELSLVKSGHATICGVESHKEIFTARINVSLSDEIQFKKLDVAVCALPAGIDALLGMDAISCGDLLLLNGLQKTTMTFRVPPSEVEINF